MAEIIKYGIIADRALFDYLRTEREGIISLGDGIIHIIKRSCELKAEVVSRDEKEAGLRAILNFGHTVGHAIETVTGYKKFLHGEAVAIGMCAAADIAVRLGIYQKEDAKLLRNLVEEYKLPCEIPEDVSISDIVHAMEIDKKVKAGKLRFIFPISIGQVKIEENVDRDLIKEVLTLCKHK